MYENTSTLVLLGYCFRMFLISITGQVLGVCIAGTMLKRRWSILPLLSFMTMKFVLIVCVLQTLFGAQLQEAPWYNLVNLLGSALGAVITAFLFYMTFHGSAIKCITAMNITEILVSIIMLPAVMVVNLLQKRDNFFLFQYPFRLTDLLIPVVEILIFLIFYRFTRKFLEKYRAYQLKYPKLWWAVYLVYVTAVQFMSIAGLNNENAFMMTMYVVFLISAVVGTLAFLFLYLNYHRGIRMERAYLNTQLGLLETHYKAIQSQVQQMESCQMMIAEQMEKITSEKETALSSENTKIYLDNLKQEYSKLRAGMYCDDWRVDAVLYCQIETARTYGIDVECQIQGYDGKVVEQQAFSKLLFLLLHNGIKMIQQKDAENSELGSSQNSLDKKIQLRTGIVTEKFVISFYASEGKEEQIQKKQIRKLIKDNGGTVTSGKDGDGVAVVITFG